MPHRRPVQLDPALYVGTHRIFVTMCTFHRYEHFVDDARVEPVLDELLRTARAYRVEIPAYCFMPDHLHLLIEGLCADSDLLRFMKMFRQRSGHSYRARTNVRLWQEGFVDTFLRAEEASLDVAGYIVANPVRAGLVRDARDYPYLGSTRYSIDELIDSLA